MELRTTDTERADWSDKIRKARRSRGWTQQELAQAAAVSLAAIQKMESGTDGGIRMFNHLMWHMSNRKKAK